MERGVIEGGALAVVLTLIAFVVGLTMPDVDQALGLGHRSGVTHSAGVAALAMAVSRWRHAACGIAGGTGLHLAADCFPNAMIGYATVKLPFAGSIGWGASYAWLAVNAVIALAIAAVGLRRLHHPIAAVAVAVAAVVIGAGYLWRTDGGWPVLFLVLAGAFAIGWWRGWRR